VFSFFRDIASIAESLRVIAADIQASDRPADQTGERRVVFGEQPDWQVVKPPELFTYDPARHYALEQKDEEAPR
jgi:hypothetical protein